MRQSPKRDNTDEGPHEALSRGEWSVVPGGQEDNWRGSSAAADESLPLMSRFP